MRTLPSDAQTGAPSPAGSPAPAAGRPGGRARARWWGPLGLAGLVAAAYAQTLGFDFLFEDPVVLVRNRAFQGPIGWWEILTSPQSIYLPEVPGADHAYRPVLAVSVAVDRTLWGLHPGRLHISSALAHLAVVLLVWRLAWRMSGSPAVGFLAGALLAVHPSAVEPVAYLAVRVDLFVGLGIAAVLLLLRNCVGPQGNWRLAGALLCFAFALGSKETAMMIPAMVTWAAWVYPEWFAAGGRVPRRPALAARIVPLWVVLGLYGALRHLAMGRVAPVSVHLAGIPAQTLRALVATATYAEMTLTPQPTRGMYTVDSPAGLADGRVLFGLTFIGLLVAGLIWLRRRHPAAALCLGCYALALIPASNVVPIYYAEVIQAAERSLYPALVGWCLFLAISAHAVCVALRVDPGRSRALAMATSGVVIGVFLLVTAMKVGSWRDDVTLWKASLAANPSSFLTRLNLGWALARAGDLQGAQAIVQEATAHFPPDHRTAYLAGWVAELRGEPSEALRQYERAISLGATESATIRRAAVLAARLKEWDRARHLFQLGADRYPQAAWPQVGLGWDDDRQGRADRARSHFDRAARLEPSSPEPAWLLSQLLAAEGRRREAVQASRAALALDPSFVPARRALAMVAEQEGQTAEAMAHWRHIADSLPAEQQGEALEHLRRLEAAAGARGGQP